MKVTLSKSKSAEQVYISRSYRDDNGKSTSRIFKKLGSMADLLPEHDNDRDKVIAWAREQAKMYTELEKKGDLKVPVELSETHQIAMDEQVSFGGGYLFLQQICYRLGLDKICKSISKRYSFDFDLSAILMGLIYARILSPSSKLSSYEYLQTLIEQPSFDIQHIYRALDVLDKESEFIQSSLYKNTAKGRNSSILYYDCTNFFFEIEDEAGIRKYGKSKEHRPNPIVQMGLFLDGDGMPLAFTIFPGNESEQPTLVPMEKKILKDFELSRFIICTDAGLASTANRRFNDRAGRSFIVTQPLKKLKEYLREWALDPTGWSLEGSNEVFDISKIDENKYFDRIFHKERWIDENDLEQRLIVSYSPKYKNYQQGIRQRQVERAVRMIDNGQSSFTRNPNSPRRFIDEMSMTGDGEVAEITSRTLDTDRISEESLYDGFTACCTTLEDDISMILAVNKRRWEIEESFRIMKSEFKARPVYLQKDERIRAHFLTCFLSLLVYRVLEKELDEKYTTTELVSTLRNFNFHRIRGLGYMPLYKRSVITDDLHEKFKFRTDKEIIIEKKMKKIIQETKK